MIGPETATELVERVGCLEGRADRLIALIRARLAETGSRPVATDWLELAACRGLPVGLFFDPETGHEALAVCSTCPVAQECLDDALAWPAQFSLGVRGGTTEAERGPSSRDTHPAVARVGGGAR